MGIFTQLDVVNTMMGLLGEVGVNSLSNEHPLTSKCLSYLRTANAREQGRGWWFNTERITLNPTDDGEIILPADTLQVDPVPVTLQYAQRGRKLYKLFPGRGQSPYQFGCPIEVKLVRLLPFEDLPTQAQAFISLSAQHEFMLGPDGDLSKADGIKMLLRDAHISLNAEHIRQKDTNLLHNPTFQATFGSLRGPGAGFVTPNIRIR